MAEPAPLKASQKRKAEHEEAITAGVTWEVIRRQGSEELKRPTRALAWSGLAAGLSMGFSFVAEGLFTAYLPDAAWRPLVSKLGYSVGFLIVILGSQQLFTENTLTVVVPALARRNATTLRSVFRLWGVVLLANLVGAHLFTLAVVHMPVFTPDIHAAFAMIGAHAIEPGFWAMFSRAIFAGWLIALMVWMLPGASRARFPTIVLMTWLVGVGGLAHVVAGSADVLYGVFTGSISWLRYAGGFLVPALLGNTVGGVMLVTSLNHAQVVAGQEGEGGGRR